MFNKDQKKILASSDHEHTYLPLQQNAIRTVFEPFTAADGEVLYRMVEYMYLFCKCGEAITSAVKKTDV